MAASYGRWPDLDELGYGVWYSEGGITVSSGGKVLSFVQCGEELGRDNNCNALATYVRFYKVFLLGKSVAGRCDDHYRPGMWGKRAVVAPMVIETLAPGEVCERCGAEVREVSSLWCRGCNWEVSG